LSTDVSEVRTASIISTSQKTILNIILAAVRTWNLTNVPMPLCPHKSHMDWPGAELGPLRRELGD
jgi:hypothetical protein